MSIAVDSKNSCQLFFNIILLLHKVLLLFVATDKGNL